MIVECPGCHSDRCGIRRRELKDGRVETFKVCLECGRCYGHARGNPPAGQTRLS